MRLKLVTGLMAAAVGAMLLLAACGDDETPEEKLCNELERLETEVQTLQAMDLVTVPLSELQDQVGEVGSAMAAVRQARGEVGQERVTSLDDAVQALSTTISDLSADFSIEQAANAIRSAVQGIEDAAAALGTEANCPQN